MIEILDCIVLPHVGAYNPGDKVELEPDLEAQLVAGGKANFIFDPDLLIERPWPPELAEIHKSEGFKDDPEDLKRQIENAKQD